MQDIKTVKLRFIIQHLLKICQYMEELLMCKMAVSSNSMIEASLKTLLFRVESFKQVMTDTMSSTDHTSLIIMLTCYQSVKYLL